MSSNQIKENINNNTGEIANQSGNMYSYNDDTIKNPPHVSNAIRRSLGEGINPNLNNLPTLNPTQSLDKFKQSTQTHTIGGTKTQNLPQFPNYIDNRSSEQRIPNLQENRAFQRTVSIEQQRQPPVYLPQPREPKKFHLLILTIILIYHVLMIALIGVFFKFEFSDKDLYNFFKDMHIMLFIGFGFLYTMLKDYQWSSVAIVLFFGTISIEFSFFCYYLWNNTFTNSTKWKKQVINFSNLGVIEYFSATFFISLGALIGKLSLIQYFWVAILETLFASFNYFLCYKKIEAIDNGGSMYVFTFGAIFGVVMSIILFCRENENSKILNNPHLGSDYYSNIFSFIGTLFLWIYFPSFNITNIQNFKNENIYDIMRYRGILNTYLSMVGSIISTFIVNPLIFNGKIKIEHLLNASYVGGVIIGGCCTICTHGWAAILIGSIGGALSTFCLWKLKQTFKNCKLEDTLGILHIFGIPGILGGFLTCIFIGSEKSIVKEIVLNEDIKPSQQAGLQVGALMVTIALAGLSGLISGFIVNSMICEKNEIYFVDSELFTEDENIPLPEWKYPRQNDFNLSSSGNKLDEQGREENNIEQN